MDSHGSNSIFVDADELRTNFASAMSAMYRKEVPLYGDLVNIVRDVNTLILQKRQASDASTTSAAIRTSSERLTLERHGAIRLGTPYELQTVTRIFKILGMHPVGYYDLSLAGLPMHATCFRPTEVSSLDKNPFRVFTTLLRPELLASEEARKLSLTLLGGRKIFTDKLLGLLDRAESQGGRLDKYQAEVFIPQALFTFSWKPIAAATFSQYNLIKAEHPILADIACFQSSHINHLTPRTLDIDAVQEAMQRADMAVKSRIEGPPLRKCPILLRQTSFLALEEAVKFPTDGGKTEEALVEASHKARFGEIEERGAAVTAKGRELYDRLLSESREMAGDANPKEADAIVADTFRAYPDDWVQLRRQGLIFCEFRCVKKPAEKPKKEYTNVTLLEQLILDGVVQASPITYEDFLPFSAAGIFQSNLKNRTGEDSSLDLKPPSSDREGLEEAIQTKLLNADDWYA
ncbi:uncharacterized protein NECHADRAFT_48843 [Fusarium vanettenii 77-13-4]|uniref:2-oxoadipate dioxygenase/decarboxylase n=1 Tax=Fusarium vanettenii (strain ATCC MYA-4622 / CBS 123669 / FGSC 9596 / NRRL 45880 / 77-13-4) TaxID=660122 RepID=C7YVI2_FUSV7|nr:uncharacterized protein NECHADRAFT_48843 [Fusarium vanettenii 77-13-4]EEU44593.1 hypothetical protein NECHADRAFT_48843 [Fusarium vanettenii 77-13-4]